MRISFLTTKQVARALNISKAVLDRLAMPNADKNNRFYIQFSGGNGALRLYPRQAVKAKMLELGASEQDVEQTLSAFDIQSTQSA